MNGKEFGKFTAEQMADVLAQLRALAGIREFFANKAGESPKFQEILIPWAPLYEFPFLFLLAIFLDLSELGELVHNAAEQPDPQGAWLEIANTELKACEAPEYFEENLPLFIPLLFACLGNVDAMAQYSQSMCDLVARAKGGDDEALFRAVAVDSAVLGAPSIALRITKAAVADDKDFFNQLAKAITRTRPRRPKPEYDELRYMVEVVKDGEGANLNHTQLYELFVNQLKLYPDAGEDPLAALKKLLQKRDKTTGK